MLQDSPYGPYPEARVLLYLCNPTQFKKHFMKKQKL